MAASRYGKPGNTLSDDIKTQVLTMCRAGRTRNDIARELGIGAASVSGIVERAGLSFDRRGIAAATEARRIDLAARRSRIIDRGYTRLEALQDRLEAPKFKTLVKGQSGAEQVRELAFVPTVDERNLADTFARYVTSLTRLEQVDAERPADSATNLLTDLGVALGIVQPDA
jgi:hypothetical protein